MKVNNLFLQSQDRQFYSPEQQHTCTFFKIHIKLNK